jgi:hypothetical protein
MVVTLLGMVMELREGQLKNALSPMAVTLSGIVIVLNEGQ